MTHRPDPLDAPLGAPREAAERRAAERAGTGGRLAWILAGLGMAGFVGLVAMTQPKAPGGRPQAVATIETVTPPPAPAPPAAAPTAPPPAAVNAAQVVAGTMNEDGNAARIEAASGVRVNRIGGAPPGALIIEVPQPGGAPGAMIALNPAPDSRLIEKSPQGPIPKIAADGARPSDVYARPVVVGAAIKPGAPRVALYVGGLGLASGATQSAIALPPAVTLAFAAVGEGLPKQTAQARDVGHEVLLQAPMEPPDYPANDPGPTTLLASDPARNIERLHMMMARFPGYVGLANHLGGRFLSDEAALAPVLRDVAGRGLFYVEDMSSEQSLVGSLAPGVGLTALRADVVVDRRDTPDAVKASLDELEAIARKRGTAIGAASALPNALAQIKRWADGLEGRGVALVPLSAMAPSMAPSMASSHPGPRAAAPAPRKR
jgi:hypothetical protein